MVVKVSVVVPTYNSGKRLAPLVESLDRQSLTPQEFEVVFVDDGSTDATPDRLTRIAAERPHVRTASIPNSGWPGRPRNVGTDLATGEYVIYVDHDDELFPEALERMYDFARANDSDVVIGKEVRSGAPVAGMALFDRNRARMPLGGALFSLITPHKLYRRRFLTEHGIRFPEGPRRIEDHLFNAEVYLSGAAVSVLADYPCYRWITHKDNSNNSRQEIDQEAYWRYVAEIVDVVRERTEPGPIRDAIMMKWYRGRLVWFAKEFGHWDAAYRRASFGPLTRAAELFPAHLDGKLSATHRARTRLVRAGDAGGLARVADLDLGVKLDARVEEMRWEDGALRVRATGIMAYRDGSPYLLRRDGERLTRVVPAELERLFRPEDRDVTTEMPRVKPSACVRDRVVGTDWAVPCVGGVDLVDVPGGLAVRSSFDLTIDPSTVVFGGPLTEGVWELQLKTEGMGYDLRQRPAVERLPAAPALVDGRAVVAYVTEGGRLAIDVGHHARTVVGAARPTPADATLVADGDGIAVTVALPAVHCRGESTLIGELIVGASAFPATLTGDGRGATVTARLPAPAASGPVVFRFLGRDSRAVFRLDHGGLRPISSSAGRRAGGVLRTLRRGLGRVRRRLRGAAQSI